MLYCDMNRTFPTAVGRAACWRVQRFQVECWVGHGTDGEEPQRSSMLVERNSEREALWSPMAKVRENAEPAPARHSREKHRSGLNLVCDWIQKPSKLTANWTAACCSRCLWRRSPGAPGTVCPEPREVHSSKGYFLLVLCGLGTTGCTVALHIAQVLHETLL